MSFVVLCLGSWSPKISLPWRKVNKFGLPRAEVFALIVNCGLLSLCNICYEVADICGFVQRWHRDTNTFYMPFDEISITLDDVSSLLHLPIMG